MSVGREALALWQQRCGAERQLTQRLDTASLDRFSAACGHDDPTTMPLQHWAWFNDAPPVALLGPDGHPRRGDFLPAIGLPRRMFAGAEIAWLAPLAMNEPATLTVRIVSVEAHAGRSGDLVILTVRHRILQGDILCVEERRSILYRGESAPAALPTVTRDGAWTPSPIELFRFSAATFNAHRIHYDREYAHDVEGYPERVVQGPLTAARLARLAAVRGPLRHFAFRAHAPLFCGQPVALALEDGRGTALRCDGTVAMTCETEW